MHAAKGPRLLKVEDVSFREIKGGGQLRALPRYGGRALSTPGSEGACFWSK
jgi:hypothetical protein